MKIFFVFCWITSCAWFLTFWSWFYSSTWLEFSSCMMIARSKTVRLAPIWSVVKPTSWKTTIFNVSPSSVRPSSTTSHTATYSTTTDQIFSWDSCLLFLSTCNADSVTKCFNSTKSPAWSASALISDFLDWFAVWPLLPRIKVLRNCF